MFLLPRSMASSCFVSAAALPKGRRCLSGQGLAVPVAQLPGSRPWTPMGSLRSSGDPSRAFAPFLDPGRTDVPSPSRSRRCCPRFAHSEGFRRWLISGLTGAASCFALLLTRKARFRLAGSAFAGRESNPPDRYERFQLVLTIILPSCSPDASAIRYAIAPYGPPDP